MSTDLRGRVVVVTGGNGGIGLGLAEGVALAGADVAIWGRDETKSERAQAHLAALAPDVRVTALRCDVTDEHQVDAALAGTVAQLGPIDAVFANAGTGTDPVPFVDLSLDEWRRVMSINLDGAFLTLRAAARHMVERGEGGSLVAISSISALQGAPRMEHYSASKAGLLALARGLAVELARHRIRCNALLPGWTDTEMLAGGRSNEKWVDGIVRSTPARRWGDPADFRTIAAYLADPTMLFHTGDALVIDGGYSVR